MDLFSPYRLGRFEVKNRIVMAPMTRSRAVDNVPNELMREYYAERASAGLIVTEGTAPSPNGLGYARIPGLFSETQIDGWRVVTDAVHREGGRLVAQLMHTGRIGHPLNMPEGARVLGPSAVRAGGEIYTDRAGRQAHPEPAPMTPADIRVARSEFVNAAKKAIEAGFDGIELHGANGYLLEQFLHPHTNRRTDVYGGNLENRSRFVVEVAEAASQVIGNDRVGIRLSPYGTLGDLPPHDEVEAQYAALGRALRGLLYIHLVGSADERFPGTAREVRRAYGGPIILNGGFDAERAGRALDGGGADLVSFGRPFVANPDLPLRFKLGAPLASADPATFFTAGREGYLDYPPMEMPLAAAGE